MEENRNSVRQAAVGLRLTEPPSASGAFHFKLVYALGNGDTFEATGSDVRLY